MVLKSSQFYYKKSYDQAIEMAKMTSDYLWLGSAMEGWVCATVLLEYLQADIGVRIRHV